MELINPTGMPANFTTGSGVDGREWIVVAVKGTFDFPVQANQAPTLSKAQLPLALADEFTGEPGFSSPTVECDFAPRKLKCDVLLSGSAYAPKGQAIDRVPVSMRVGSVFKAFDVVGNRSWKATALSISSTRPEPFVRVPITYDRAFGGIDRSKGDEATFRYYPMNHAGVGWHEYLESKFVDGKPLPNTEEPSDPVRKPNGKYRPMAFGPIGRAWQPRPKFAGTYDQNWQDNIAPFLPKDFQEAYHQSAPPDQQCDYLTEGEVELINLTPEGRTQFRLPPLQLPVEFTLRQGGRREVQAVVDTLTIHSDLRQVSIVWRALQPIRRDVFEVPRMIVGRMSRSWYRAREANKLYFPSLAQAPLTSPVANEPPFVPTEEDQELEKMAAEMKS